MVFSFFYVSKLPSTHTLLLTTGQDYQKSSIHSIRFLGLSDGCWQAANIYFDWQNIKAGIYIFTVIQAELHDPKI